MWFPKRISRLTGFGLFALTLGIFWACQVSQDGGHTYLNIKGDSAYTKFDRLLIVVKDSSTGMVDTVFNQHLNSLGDLSRIPIENYQGQKVNITVTGFQNGQAVYQEVRQYDGQNPGNTSTVVVDSVVPVDSVRASTHNLTLKNGGSFKEISAAVYPSKINQTVLWTSLDLGVATVQPKSGDPTHVLVSPVALGHTQIIAASQKDPGKTDTVSVTVTDGVVLSSNADLATLTISAGILNNPAFSPNSRVSGAAVANAVTATTVTAMVADTTATLTVNGIATGSGVASAPISLAVGVDSVFVVVTAQDSTKKTYVIGITRSPPNASSNANLATLTISAGVLNNPAFSPANGVAGLSVVNGVGSTTVTATVADTTARLAVNGATVSSGVASAPISLAVGVDSISVVVTAQDATQKTYVIVVTRAAGRSSNANLATLTISAGVLNSPAFNANNRVSGASVANDVKSTTVTATVADTTAHLTINGIPTGSGVASAPDSLAVGVDSIFIVVTAQDSTKKTYAIAITRSAPNASSNANLSTLTVSAGTLNAPAFNPANRVSGLAVANGVSSTTVTATVADSTAHVTVNGVITSSGVASTPLALAIGVDSIFVVVTAQDATQKTYVIVVTRAAGLSSNANLATLTVSAGTLNTPAFNANSRASGASVANTVTSTTVTATVADTTAKLTINGIATGSGVASAPISLAVGVDSIFVVVTAQDSTKKTYAIAITRSAPNASSNANLSTLTVSAGTLNAPAFNPANRVSGLAVANGVSSTTVTATVADSTAHVTVNGVITGSGVASTPIALAAGVDSIMIIVTAQDATQKTYVVAVTRAKSSNANLSTLTISGGTLNAPAFNAANRVSGAVVLNSVNSTTVTATVADTTARLTINAVATGSGVASSAIPLAVGVDSIFVVVTAQDSTKKTYAIGITRATSSVATLSSLISSVTPVPVFDPATITYTATVANSVTSVTLTATATYSGATVTINSLSSTGALLTSVPLSVGSNPIGVVVTAENGTTKTYTFTITRSASSDASLATLTVTPGTISPALTAGITAYTVNYTTDSTVSVKATPTQSGSSMTWKGGPLTAGTFSTPGAVNYGSTPFNLVVTAPDGVTKTTYVVTVVRVDNVPPNAPAVVSMPSRVYVSSPTWSWSSGGNGGSGSYRYKFDNTDLTTGATTVAGTSIAPVISDGPHTLYVQEQDAAGNWSTSGSASTIVMFGPASWYKFNGGDYTDYGFNKNNGTTPVALTLVPSPRGTANGAASFDGTNYLTLGTPTYPTANSNITLTCWIKLDTSNTAGYAFWGQLLIYAGSGVVGLGVNDSTSSPPVLRNFAYAQVPADTWVHIAGTFDGTNLRIFANGSPVSTFTFPTAGYPELQDGSTIGFGNGGYWPSGALDDVRVYNRILTDTEINSISAVQP